MADRTCGELFTGIGGLSLGLERAGMTPCWFAEKDPLCSAVLAARWPGVPNFGDVTSIDFREVPRVDVLAGGFPCQDISSAGRRAGLEGEHSGLWAHFARAVRDVRPGHVIVENVPALLSRGIGTVLADLAAVGYDAEWDCIPAAAVGAPHLRTRLWVLAYPCGERDAADDALQAGWPQPELHPWWETEPAVGRVVDGLPRRLAGTANRWNGAFGNAVVPQVAEHVAGLTPEGATCG